MASQLSSERLRPRENLGPAVGSLRGERAGEVFVPGDARYDGALSLGWLIGRRRSFGHVLSTLVGRGLAKLLSRLRAVRHPWWELSDYFLTDIGKTRGDAEFEKLRRRPTIRDPYEPMARDIRLQSDS